VRLFVALEIPRELRAKLVSLIAGLRSLAPRLKWVRAENLHVTLKFIGHIENEKRAEIEVALGKVRSPEPLTLHFRGLGFFPNDKRPRVFWIGMEGPSALPKLATDIDATLHELGFPLETRPFSPHLTLARVDESEKRLPDTFRQAVQERVSIDFGDLNTSEFSLVESKLKPTGAEYTTLRAFHFVSVP
jgi:RNA 2',3'-cyclic 3'-phosphodiesterase